MFELQLPNYSVIFLLQLTLWISCQMPVSNKLLHKGACSWWGKKKLTVSSIWRCDHQQAHNWLWTTMWGSLMFGISSCWKGQVYHIQCSPLTGNDNCNIHSVLKCSTPAAFVAKLHWATQEKVTLFIFLSPTFIEFQSKMGEESSWRFVFNVFSLVCQHFMNLIVL